MPNRRNNKIPMFRTDNVMRIRTLGLVAAFLIFGFGILIYQLYVLQLRDVEKYRTEAVEQQMQDETIPAMRGSIYSATGKLLAKSTTVYNIIADPSFSAEVGAGYLQEASERIAEILNDGTTAETILEKLSDSARQYKILAKGVDKPTADAMLALEKELRLPGEDGTPGEGGYVISLWTEQSTTRSYPYGAFMSSVLGFCDAQGSGFYGLEKSYNDVLAGTDGRSIAETNVSGQVLANTEAEVYAAIDGGNLHLTIDEYIQGVVEEYLGKAIEDFNVQNRGCAIVMNVKTGKILGMATMGQFDPNDPYQIYDEELSTILENRLLDANTTAVLENRLGKEAVEDYLVDGLIDDSEYTTIQGMMREAQWKNKNITELYYPGSVFKLITAAAALDSGLMDTTQTFYCDSAFTVNAGTDDEHTYRCADGNAHGLVDMALALNKSCNLYFIQAAELMSPKVFFDYFEAFGFTQTTGVDLPSETRWMQYHDQAAMEAISTNLYSAAFGQNMAITPLQMATAVAAVTNGGYLVTPYVVDYVTDNDGNVISENETAIRRQVISEEVSAQIRAMMEDNVGHGDSQNYHSCKNAYVAGYRIGGKSGTAEQLNLGKRYDDDYRKAISFAAVLPIDDPEIEVFVMLDDPRWVEDFASQIVAPVVGNIISEIAPYLGISQDPDYAPTGNVTIPNAVGDSWTTAQVDLNVVGLKHKLIGPTGTIVYQYPYAGTSVPAGSTIYMYTTTDQSQQTVVPDVTGKTGAFAKQMLQAAGLNAQISGDENDRVIAQDYTPDTNAAMGTVVTVTTGAAESAEPPVAEEAIVEEE